MYGKAAPWKLFLDDVRDPARSVEDRAWRRSARLPEDAPKGHGCSAGWTVARSHGEAVALVMENGLPTFASIDADLSVSFEPGSGIDFARFLAGCAETGRHGPLPRGFAFEAHTESPSARDAIEAVMSFARERAVAVAA